MPFPDDTAILGTAVLATAVACVTAFGVRRHRYAGWSWWIAALWLTVAGAGVAALVPGRAGSLLAAPLLLQWPLLTLTGLRRFHARHGWPGSERTDRAVLALGLAGSLLGPLAAPADAPLLLAGCGLLVHLYAAAVLSMGSGAGGRDSTPLQALAAAIALAAFAPGAAALLAEVGAAWPLQPGGTQAAALALQVRAMAAVLGALVLCFVVLTLVFDRTERQLRDSRRRLRILANLDTLTQVPNRRRFRELAEQALQQDAPGSAVMLLFDVDHFKQINDHFGHAAGDRALCLVSASVQEHLRAVDVAGRHGGDEFVMLLRQATPRDAMGVAARIVAEVQARARVHELPALTLSFGLVQVRHGEEVDAALRRADQALYEAKRQGRSRVVAAQGDELRPVFSESRPLGLSPA